jgi:LysR family transcriptional regulator, hydrogen peroxide-inducible genes activator
MELFQVRYFLALARTLNFTRAAEACHVSQPALTRAIQRLEEELGGPLLHRERNLTQLTALGRVMLPYLEAAHAAAESAAAQAAAFQQRDCEPLRLGIDATLSARILTPALHALQARLPGFAFTLTESASGDLLERLIAGDLDSAVMVEPAKPPERLQHWRLFADRYVVLCPLGHPLAALLEITLQALAAECLLGREQPSDIEQVLDRLCAVAGVTLKPRHRCASEDQLRQMVAAGLGIALSAEHGAAAPGIVARPLADPATRRDIVLTAIAGRRHSPALAAFLKLMRARDWREQETPLVSKP